MWLSWLVAAQAAPQWQIQKSNLATILLGVDFVDANTGYASGAQDGEGPIVLKSTDGGNNFTEVPHAGSALLFLDLAFHSKTNGVVGGVAAFAVIPGIEYTTTGNYFNRSIDAEFVAECQSVEAIKGAPGAFGLAGTYGKKNGVAVSTDFGVTFKHIDAGLNTSSRYGSFPSKNVWYLSAGQFPNTSLNGDYFSLTERIFIHRKSKRPSFRLDGDVPRTGSGDGYDAAIAKTTDGGKTWKTVFYDDGNFYLNAISCPTENDCWVVGESDDGPAPGGRILHSGNGGATWEVQFYNPTPAFSLLAIEMITPQEGWALGGKLDITFTGEFLHTVDGGKTWTTQTLKGVYGSSLRLLNNTLGWATAFTRQQQSSILKYA